MEIGNSVLRVGIEPTSLVFWASVLTITPPTNPGVLAYMYMRLLASEVCEDYMYVFYMPLWEYKQGYYLYQLSYYTILYYLHYAHCSTFTAILVTVLASWRHL